MNGRKKHSLASYSTQWLKLLLIGVISLMMLDGICGATPQQLFDEAVKYAENNDFARAVPLFRKAAEQGDAQAQNNLGLCYDNGDGVAKDSQQAVYWWRKAAEQGDRKSVV